MDQDRTLTPNWDDFPNLDDAISKLDVEKKGSGSYQAEYINWCKAAQLLRTRAKGWQFELRTTLDVNGHDTDVFRAPNGTGYLKGFFRAPTGSGFCDTPDFPQAIMDNRNQPKQWDAITSRDVTDTHRRCMCTAAAAHFGLAWQLWAKVDIENPMREAEPAPAPKAAPKKVASSKKADIPPTQADQTATAVEPSIQERVESELVKEFAKHNESTKEGTVNKAAEEWKAEFKKAFKLSPEVSQISRSLITTPEQFDWTKKFLDYYSKPQPA